ncbi:MAG: guanylate kinase, partial [Methylocystis sp.]
MIAPIEPLLPLRRGVVFILSSPSGAGKTTLTRMMLQNRDLDLNLSISVTTRSRRSSEVDSIHYRFISERQF